jgi:murein DD-endopeptidase MepM/ murein hydrolase activator NlpD
MKSNKNKYIAVFSCFVLAAVFAVGLSVTTADKARKNDTQNISQQDEVPQPSAEVSLNKNAPAKTENKVTDDNQVKQTTPQKTENSTTVKPESSTQTAPAQEKKTVYEYGDEFEEAGLFDDALIFSVPVSGEIAMDYSADKMVYDATLEQYRTNDSICYAAEEGTAVSAAAGGTVESVVKDNVKGTSITVFHGDGWRTTYSQLSDDVAVSQGDIVEKGQTLGYVGSPSKYSSAMGSHLEFKMTLDGNSVDPKMALAE